MRMAQETMEGSIPKRPLRVWQTPLNIRGSEKIIYNLKLQCFNCMRTFDDEARLVTHLKACAKPDKEDVNYNVHLHANRMVACQNRVALFCGASDQTIEVKCRLCGLVCEDEPKLRRHIHRCKIFHPEFGMFISRLHPFFHTLLISYETLNGLFQKYVMDETIIRMRKEANAPIPEGQIPTLEPVNLNFDALSELFIEKYQEYIFEVINFTNDAFIRYLRKIDMQHENQEKPGRTVDGQDEEVESEVEEDSNDEDENEVCTEEDLEADDEDENISDVDDEELPGEEVLYEEGGVEDVNMENLEDEDEDMEDESDWEGFTEDDELYEDQYLEEPAVAEPQPEVDTDDEIIDVVGL
ncbi:unnamed protein product [Caenorhabditis sp. 36 PRJEB53466]|nr:unnamed protein product [Caenorhabditis sp. 36 PRJEB53466]